MERIESRLGKVNSNHPISRSSTESRTLNLSQIKKWDKKVKEVFSPDDLWFALFSPITCKLDSENKNLGRYRDDRARKDLKDWLYRLGLKYHSPHKFRRRYAIYSIELSKNSKDMKAISQNMMHSSISTTERYIDLPEKELKEKILGLVGNAIMGKNDVDNIVDKVADKVIKRFLEEIKDIKQK